MTPQLGSLLTHALQVTLDQGHYCNPGRKDSSTFMCLALKRAVNSDCLSEEEGRQASQFLGRWVRWMAHLTKARTNCLVNIAFRLSGKKKSESVQFTDAWDSGEGERFYRALIQRLEQKSQRTSH